MSPRTMQLMVDEAQWIATDAEFAALCESARDADSVAIDTEFERTDTFYPKLALVQFCIGDRIALLDPLALADVTPLRALLEDPSTEKVLHSCSEDVEVLAAWCGARPQALFDTQIAAAFCGGRYGIGYRDLVVQEFGVELDKDATRSNWLHRPLSAVQIRYAALDVALLLPLKARQEEALSVEGRVHWLREECDRAVSDVLDRPGPETAWRNVKRAGTLGARGLAALQRLAAWRERRARELDRPKGWLLKDEQLILLAGRLPERIEDLAGEGLPAGAVRRFGSELQPLLDAARGLPESELPQALPPPMGRAENERMKAFRKRAQAHAQRLGVAEELLARKRLIEPLFQPERGHAEWPEALRGWRWDILAGDLEALRTERES
ncbi:MAG: ribonuclease D [Gammaproteobacteria bacterium]|nr:MAG: ribonuclease D [Gammaproteobacteria bacterium]